jgi:hypothetical protein
MLRTHFANQTLRHTAAGVVVAALMCASSGRVAADPDHFDDGSELSVAVQFPLILKILQFDRNLVERVGKDIVIACVYQGRYRASTRARDDLRRVSEQAIGPRVSDLPVRVVEVDIEQMKLEDALDMLEIDVVYLMPLRAVDIGEITRITRAHDVATVTGVEDYVQQGVAVGLGVYQEKPRVLVNLEASRQEGMEFSSRLLSIARVVN